MANSLLAASAPVVLRLNVVFELALLLVPVWSSGLLVATPLHSLSWAIVLAPLEPVLNTTEVTPAGVFGRYHSSIGPLLPRHTFAAITQPVGAENVSVKQFPLMSSIAAASRSPLVDADDSVGVIVAPDPVASVPCCTSATLADATAGLNAA